MTVEIPCVKVSKDIGSGEAACGLDCICGVDEN